MKQSIAMKGLKADPVTIHANEWQGSVRAFLTFPVALFVTLSVQAGSWDCWPVWDSHKVFVLICPELCFS